MIFNARDYQKAAAGFMLDRPRSGLFLDPGLGKTSITLLALKAASIAGRGFPALVVAPLRVVYNVWPNEVCHWDQFNRITVSIVHGDPGERAAALRQPAELFLINPDAIGWLYDYWFADRSRIPRGLSTLIVDESTRFKTHDSICWRSMKAILPRFRRRHILTGTPCANTLEALWTQIFILDGGKRLGKNITAFRERWFYQNKYHRFVAFPHAKKEIEAAIADIVLRVDGGGFVDLPELLINDVDVDLPSAVLKAYKRLERELFFEIESVEKTVFTAAAKYNLCRQVANGGVYVDDPNLKQAGVRPSETVHDSKIDVCESIVEELAGKPALIVYHFKHDLKRLRAWRSGPAIEGGQSAKSTADVLAKWNRGELPILFAQCQTISHGLNMQGGGAADLIWLGLPDDLEIYLQTIKRIHRSGSSAKQVRIHRVTARATVDVLIRRRLDARDMAQASFLDALRRFTARYVLYE